jgi:hypothetical protein
MISRKCMMLLLFFEIDLRIIGVIERLVMMLLSMVRVGDNHVTVVKMIFFNQRLRVTMNVP